MVSQGLVAFAFVIGAAYFLSRREPLSEVMAPWVFQDLGNLLLAFVMLWAYTSFSQFLLIWVENLSHAIPCYLHRTRGGRRAIAVPLPRLPCACRFLLFVPAARNRKPAP